MARSFEFFCRILLLFVFSISVVSTTVAQSTTDKQDQAATAAVAQVDPTDDADLSFIRSGGVPTSVSQLKAMEKLVAEITAQCKPATVNVRVGEAQGSGVLVSRDGFILTAAHVIGGPNKPATVTLPDGEELEATTLGTGPFRFWNAENQNQRRRQKTRFSVC